MIVLQMLFSVSAEVLLLVLNFLASSLFLAPLLLSCMLEMAQSWMTNSLSLY